jgi:hypothetical protein
MGHTIGDAKGAIDDTCARLDGAAKTKRLGTLTKQRPQLRALRGGQTGSALSGFAAYQRSDTAGAVEPFADATLGAAQGSGNPLLRSVLLLEFPDVEPMAFAPIGGLG